MTMRTRMASGKGGIGGALWSAIEGRVELAGTSYSPIHPR